MKCVACVSGGKDSIAMLLELIRREYQLDEVVFYDTGMEYQAIYNNMNRVKQICEQNEIKYTVLKPDTSFLYDMIDREVTSRKGEKRNGYSWCGGACRWGTSKKKAACDKHTKGSHVYIGIAADETKRLERIEVWKSAPLAEWGMDEADCLKLCYDNGFSWNEGGVELYSILDRVSCWCCANKNRKELKNMYLHLPEYWEKLKYLQSKIDRPMKKFRNRKYGEYGNVFDMEAVFRIEEQNHVDVKTE